MKKIYTAKWIFTCSPPRSDRKQNDLSYQMLEDYAIVVEKEKIVSICPFASVKNVDQTIVKDFGNAVITPSFVNLYADLRYTNPQMLNVASIQAGTKKILLDTKFLALKLKQYSAPIQKWSEVYKAYYCTDENQKKEIIKEALKQLLLSGTTCFGTCVDSEDLFEQINEVPAIKFCFYEVSSIDPKKRLQTFKELVAKLEFYNNHKSQDTYLGVKPLSIYQTDIKIWQLLARYCRLNNLPLFTNFMEIPEERNWLKGDGKIGVLNRILGQCELECVKENLSPVEYLKKCWGANVIVSGALELSVDEMIELAQAGVKYAYSPRANDKFFNKSHSYNDILNIFKRNWGFATYSLAHNYDSGVLGEFKYIKLKNKPDLFETMRHLTIYPAQILGLDGIVGSVDTGKLANFNVYKLNYNENFTSILNKENPQYVFFRGKMIVGNGNCLF